MIRRGTKIQLVAFALISILGIAYVGLSYVGINPLHSPYQVSLTLPRTGGLFPTADVTERGVSVGRVAAMRIDPHTGQVHVTLDIDDGVRIPSDVKATVANLSAVGEQYIDLEPQRAGGPYLADGSVIDPRDVTLPVEDAKLLVNLDDLVKSVDREHLATVIDELGKAFDNLGPTLSALISNGDQLTRSAIASLPQQLQLIDDSRTVLDTQNAVSAELKAYARTLRLFSSQLVSSDADLRTVFDRGTAASREVTALLRDNRSVLPTLLGNLITVNQIQSVRLPYVKATLELFPSNAAGGFYITPGDGTAHFGMVNDNSTPCTTGYGSTRARGNSKADWGGPANLDAYCHGKGVKTDYRGARNSPRPDSANVTNSDPYPGPRYGRSNHPTVAEQRDNGGWHRQLRSGSAQPSSAQLSPGTALPLPYDATTGTFTGPDGKTYSLGVDGPVSAVFGSSSWEWLLIAPTMR